MLHPSVFGKMVRSLVMLLFGCAAFVGCTMGTSTTGSGPTGISATTLSATTIRVYWTREPTDLSTDTVIVYNGTTIVGMATAASPLDSAVVPGLTSGVAYTIYVGTTSGRSGAYTYRLQFTYIPENVTVTAQDSLSITVGWTRNLNDTSADTLYVTTTTGGLAGNSPIIVPPGLDSGTITGLVPGVTYVISVVCATGSSTAISYIMPGLPTTLMVNAMNASTIGVKWTRGIADTAADTIVARSNSVTGPIAASAIVTGDSGIITGLSELIPYYITVHVKTGISDTPIVWMTAERTNGIQIYAMNDTMGDPRGLQLAANSTKAIIVPGASKPDFILDTNSSDPSGIVLEAGDSAMMNGNPTKVNPNFKFIPGGLDSIYRDSSYASNAPIDTVIPVVIPSDSTYNKQGSLVLVCQTVSGNWALLEIVPAPSGQLYSVAPNGFKYITVNVSYQAATNEPYAGRGHSGNTKAAPGKPTQVLKPGSNTIPTNAQPFNSKSASNPTTKSKISSH